MEGKELLEYACAKFEAGIYDEALEAFILAYCKGYEQEWILENIYNCYVSGNEETFREAYLHNTNGMGVAYEDCTLDFVPYREGEYYIFDKEMGVFRGVFSAPELQQTPPHEKIQKVEFSAIALALEWNWGEEKHVLTAAKEKRLYAVSQDMGRCISFWKIPELKDYAKNVKLFSSVQELQQYFHNNTAEYLPMIVFGKEYRKQQELKDILDQEHNYRLTPEGRNTENVLLTIGIPTHDRGNLLLKRLEHLRKMPYDAEIEFAVSKNGTLLYQEEYVQAGKIADARINYYDHGKELSGLESWHYTIEMSHGKYVMLVSDEDDVCLDAIEHYLKLLTDFPETALFLAKGGQFYSDIEERVYGKAGLQAFQEAFLRTNYISGLIFHRELFLRNHFLNLQRFSENRFYHYYAHMWWCTLLSLQGDYMEEPVQLFSEADSVQEEQYQKYIGMGILKQEDYYVEEISLPSYSTYEERLKQFQGQVEFLQMLSETYPEVAEAGLIRMIEKMTVLLCIARGYNYKADIFLDVVDEFVQKSMKAMDEFQFSEQSQVNILNCIKMNALYMMERHQKMTEESEANVVS